MKSSQDATAENARVRSRLLKRLSCYFRGPGRRIAWLAAMVLLALLGATIYALLYPPPVPLSVREVDERVVEAMASATPSDPFSSQVYQTILPSLVFIEVQGEDEEEEFGIGVGSGVVINEQGDILTANHVVSGATKINIVYADGTRTGATIIGATPENDIAVLHPVGEPGLIVPAVLAGLGGVQIGDEAFVVGNPLGLTGSLSAGVISGFNRSIPFDEEGTRLSGLIQFDAAVNPGNSGGPLLNRQAQVIGIVTALVNPDRREAFSGIGFAVPIGTALAAANAPPY